MWNINSGLLYIFNFFITSKIFLYFKQKILWQKCSLENHDKWKLSNILHLFNLDEFLEDIHNLYCIYSDIFINCCVGTWVDGTTN